MNNSAGWADSANLFDSHRARLRGIAERVVGAADADDVVQEAWMRLQNTDVRQIDNLGGWLTTVVARIGLDVIRSRASRDRTTARAGVDVAHSSDAGTDVEIDEAVSAALSVVLDTLAPAERVAFVLHDTFAVPFGEIAVVLNRTPSAAKQLASRARAKVRGVEAEPDVDREQHRAVATAFLVAARGGHLGRLITLLDPSVELTSDAVGIGMGSPERLDGADSVAGSFSGRALGAQVALLDGVVGLVWMVGGQAKVAWDLTIAEGLISQFVMIADPAHLGEMEVAVLGDGDATGERGGTLTG